METLRKYLKESNKKSFLDVGTGAGNFVQLLKSIYNDYDKIVGIDLMERAIEAANKQNEDERISFKVMDAYNMEFEEKTFDVVILSNSLHHVDDIPKILNSMKRVLKDDGFIIINEMLADQLDKMQLSHKLLHHFSAKLDRLGNETHFDTFTEKEILKKVQEGTNLRISKHWQVNVERRKENSKEELEYIFDLLDRVSNRIPDDMKDELLDEKEDIKNYIKKNGYDGCTSLIVLLQK